MHVNKYKRLGHIKTEHKQTINRVKNLLNLDLHKSFKTIFSIETDEYRVFA